MKRNVLGWRIVNKDGSQVFAHYTFKLERDCEFVERLLRDRGDPLFQAHVFETVESFDSWANGKVAGFLETAARYARTAISQSNRKELAKVISRLLR